MRPELLNRTKLKKTQVEVGRTSLLVSSNTTVVGFPSFPSSDAEKVGVSTQHVQPVVEQQRSLTKYF